YFINAVSQLIPGGLVPVPGGVLIKVDGVIAGAVGISGDTSENDEAAAVAAIEALGLIAETGA
ncbi:MAG: heme-binding protein, partial [Pseudomonadota bacterium]|nr:heme-binding protein [Pseudomonadota bacterium]